MDQKYRLILERNRQLLVNNIIPSEEFFNLLFKEKVLPQAMLRDVKEGETRMSKNSRLLTALQLRSSPAFRKFRNILLETGHCFLADLLWEDETNDSRLCENIFNKFPEIFDRLPADIKKRFQQYLESKIRAKSLQASWINAAAQRMQNLQAKSEDIRQEGQLRATIEDLQKKVRNLQERIKSQDGTLRYMTIEAKGLEKQLHKTRHENKHNLEKQTNFNIANHNTILRLRERLSIFNRDIIRMNEMMRGALGDDLETYENDPENVKISILESNLNKLLEKANDKMNTIPVTVKEGNEIIHLLFPDGQWDDKENISDAVKTYVEREIKQKIRIVKEIEKMMSSLKGMPTSGKSSRHQSYVDDVTIDNRYVNNILATVRVEVEHLNKKLAWKDSEITKLTAEVEVLNEEVAMLRQRLSLSQEGKGEIATKWEYPEEGRPNGIDFDDHTQQFRGNGLKNNLNVYSQRLKGHQNEKRNRENAPLSKAKSMDYRRPTTSNLDTT